MNRKCRRCLKFNKHNKYDKRECKEKCPYVNKWKWGTREK